MKIAVMQPYIFPYITYYQLISAVDVFVLLDDVNFITRGWINRNNILLNGEPHLFSIALEKPSQNKLICDTKLSFPEKEKQKFLKKIELSYKKSPHFSEVYSVIEEIILHDDSCLTGYLHHALEKTCRYAGIETKIVRSSMIEKNNSLQAQERIIEICKQLKAQTYINLPGGKSLYHSQDFKNENIELNFINTQPNTIIYKQYTKEFVPHLSFIDMLMFNSQEIVKEFLKKYDLERAH